MCMDIIRPVEGAKSSGPARLTPVKGEDVVKRAFAPSPKVAKPTITVPITSSAGFKTTVQNKAKGVHALDIERKVIVNAIETGKKNVEKEFITQNPETDNKGIEQLRKQILGE